MARDGPEGHGGALLAGEFTVAGRRRGRGEQAGDAPRVRAPRLGAAEDQVLSGSTVQFGPVGAARCAGAAWGAHLTSFSVGASARVTGGSSRANRCASWRRPRYV